MAAVVFPMEVISVGVMYYAALVPCIFSAFAAQGIALLLESEDRYSAVFGRIGSEFYSVDSIKAIILAIACALPEHYSVLCCIMGNII